MDVQSVFKLWEGVGVLFGHRDTAKPKATATQQKRPLAGVKKQQITPSSAQGTLLSVGHHLQDQDGFLPPPGLLPLHLALEQHFLSFSPILSPSGAVWRLLLTSSTLTLQGWHQCFLHTRCSPKLELAEHLHLRNTIIFPPSSWAWRKWSMDITTFPDCNYFTHIPHLMSILNQSHSYFCAISFCSSFCFPTIYSMHI